MSGGVKETGADWVVLDGGLRAEWEAQVAARCGAVLGRAVSVSLELPDAVSAKWAWENNADLRGAVTLAEAGGAAGSPRSVRLRLPLPFSGVFVVPSRSGHAQAAVWASALADRPGLRWAVPASERRRAAGVREFRLTFPDWKSAVLPVAPGFAYPGKTAADREALSRFLADLASALAVPHPPCLAPGAIGFYSTPSGDGVLLSGRLQAVHEQLRQTVAAALAASGKAAGNAFAQRHAEDVAQKAAVRAFVQQGLRREALPWLADLLEGAGAGTASDAPTDADDLAHRRLLTFPVWLASVLVGRVYEFVANGWDVFDRRHASRLEAGLVPLPVLLSPRFGPPFLHRIAPNNVLDLMSAIRGVRRRICGAEAMRNIPVDGRQNHPSFEGRLCPLETTESESIGLALQLARGARVDGEGRIQPAPADAGVSAHLGWGASLIPFAHHNDGARNMMGAKNLRQAVPVTGRERAAIETGCEASLQDLMQPLVDAGICPDARAGDDFALGCDLLTAYLPWEGWNIDDALVVSASAAARMGIEERRDVSRTVGPEWEIKASWEKSVSADAFAALDPLSPATGVAEVRAGEVIATLQDDRGHRQVIRYFDDEPARLTGVALRPSETPRGAPVSKRLTYSLVRSFPLSLGDKLQNRHGGKGVVGAILPDEEMPRLPDDPRLGKMRGRRVDILVNPHGVLSRMNPGQLLETHLAWLVHAGKCQAGKNTDARDLLTEPARRAGLAAGSPERGAVDHAKVRELLEASGLDRSGRVRLRFADGDLTTEPVVVGFQHFVRLHHVPAQKAQARRGGGDARYAEATRQAEHGRRFCGGQRLGEMEVWALAAHRAEHVLEEMLGGKSDADWAAEWARTGELPQGEALEGFPSVLRDHLFALSIDLSCTGARAKFRILSDAAEVKRRAGGPDHMVFSADGMVQTRTAVFACKTCGWSPSPDRLAMAGNGNSRSLELRELLASWGLACGPAVRRNAAGGLELEVRGARGSATLRVELLKYADDDQLLRLRLTPGAHPPAGWPKDLPGLTCWRKATQSAKKGRLPETIARREELTPAQWQAVADWKSANLPACLLLNDLLKGTRGRRAGDYVVACTRHASGALAPRAETATGLELRGAAGGVFDPRIFGDGGWGFIELPVAVPYPQSAFGGQDDPAVPLSVVPVLPVRYRRPALLPNRTDRGDLSALYQAVVRACERFRRATNKETARDALARAVRTLFAELAERLNGKHGLLRHEGQGRRVDRSCRLVMAPNPRLEWNQAALPAAVLWELVGDQVEAWEAQKGGQSPEASEGGQSPATVGVHEVAGGWSCPWHARETARNRRRLDAFLSAHPGYVLLFNRQPSLHRDSFLALHPVLLEAKDDGGARAAEVLQLSPLALEGLAGDFDGDDLAGHVPVTPAAQQEAVGLLPDANLRSVATGRSLAHCARDLVTGLDLLGRTGAFDAPEKLGVAALGALAREAYKACTRAGVSFGFYDLVDIAAGLQAGGAADVEAALAEILGRADADPGCRAVARMVLTKANGEKGIGRILGKLVHGMDWRTFFDASWGARETMCEKKLGVGPAGDMTRHLVHALWPERIVCADCGNAVEGRSPLTCACADGVCAACYGAGHGGRLPNGSPVAVGDPVGLLAAQSIGERGTQLAMRAIHAGASVVDVAAARRLFLDGRLDPDGDVVDAAALLAAVRGWEAYRQLDVRHFQVLGRVLFRHGGVLSRAVTGNAGAALAYQGQKGRILALAREAAEVDLDLPSLRVMFNRFGRRAADGEAG